MKLFLILSILSISFFSCKNRQEIETGYVNVDRKSWESIEKKASGNTMIIDVRTETEWESGHIETAIHIPLQELQTRLSEIPKEKEILLYCLRGGRSSSAAGILVDKGYKKVYNLEGGFSQWK